MLRIEGCDIEEDSVSLFLLETFGLNVLLSDSEEKVVMGDRIPNGREPLSAFSGFSLLADFEVSFSAVSRLWELKFF